MERRIFLGVIAGTLLAAPLAAEAQQAGTSQRVGLLWPGEDPPPGHRMEWFRHGLLEAGYVEGQNLSLDVRHAEKADRLLELATQMVRANVSVIVSFGDLGPQMAQKATKTIPIVSLTDDFVGAGLVATLGRPEGNTTGVNILSPELSAKRLSLLKEMLPTLSRVAVLWDPVNSTQLKSTQNAAVSLGVKIQVLEVRGLAAPAENDLTAKRLELLKQVVPRASRIAILHDPDNRSSTLSVRDADSAGRSLGVVMQSVDARDQKDFDAAFATMRRGQADAVILGVNTPFIAHRRRLAELAVLHRLPMMTPAKEYAEAGGLLSYGTDYPDLFRHAAAYVDKILKGAKPADLPIEQPTKFELVINLKTAKALGLMIPPSLLQRADQVIE